MPDFLGQNAPGWVAKFLRGKRVGKQQEDERATTEAAQRRQAEIQEYHLSRARLQDPLEDERRRLELEEYKLTVPQRRELLAAQIANERARAEGTGSYAPDPPKPIRKPWEAAGFETEREWNQHRGRAAAAVRAPREPDQPDKPPSRKAWVDRRAQRLNGQRHPITGEALMSFSDAVRQAEEQYDALYGQPSSRPGLIPFSSGGGRRATDPPAPTRAVPEAVRLTPASPAEVEELRRRFRGDEAKVQAELSRRGLVSDEDEDEDTDPDFEELERQFRSGQRRP